MYIEAALELLTAADRFGVERSNRCLRIYLYPYR